MKVRQVHVSPTLALIAEPDALAISDATRGIVIRIPWAKVDDAVALRLPIARAVVTARADRRKRGKRTA